MAVAGLNIETVMIVMKILELKNEEIHESV